MAVIPSEHPFTEYVCYKNWHKKEERWQVCLVPRDKSSKLKRRTITYAKFVMSVAVGRMLEPHECVDHKNEDKSDDRLTNLQILTKEENEKKHRAAHPKEMWNMVCPSCKESWQMEARTARVRQKNNKNGLVFCSHICVGAYYSK